MKLIFSLILFVYKFNNDLENKYLILIQTQKIGYFRIKTNNKNEKAGIHFS